MFSLVVKGKHQAAVRKGSDEQQLEHDQPDDDERGH
jgi:hypothetical protein